jgi:hypothetical protein
MLFINIHLVVKLFSFLIYFVYVGEDAKN